MKKLLKSLLAVITIFSLTGCSKAKPLPELKGGEEHLQFVLDYAKENELSTDHYVIVKTNSRIVKEDTYYEDHNYTGTCDLYKYTIVVLLTTGEKYAVLNYYLIVDEENDYKSIEFDGSNSGEIDLGLEF